MTLPRSIPASAALALLISIPAPARAGNQPTISVDLGAGESIALVLIPKGSFTEGSPATEKDRKDDETAHPVTIGADFYIAKFPVTYGQFARFAAVTGYRTEAEKGSSGGSGFDGKDLVQRKEFTWKNPGFPQTSAHPVTLVTYDDARAFTSWVTGISGRAFDLPTEAQWEYAYRAGSSGPYYTAATGVDALSLGWFKENAGRGSHPVGLKQPNGYGLFDMGGNVFEWCRDWYAPYPEGRAVDPEQKTPDASDKPRRVLRGGSWFKEARNGRAAARYRNTPGSRNADNGFRVVAGTQVVPVTSPAPQQGSAPGALPPQPPRPPESSSSSTAGAAIFGAGCAGTVAILAVILVVALRKGAKRVAYRLGPDGFWILAPGRLRGTKVRYRWRSRTSSQEGEVILEPAISGQFVYTGHQPIAVETIQLIDPWQPPVTRSQGYTSVQRGYQSSSHHSHHSHHTSHSDPPFGGYPPAY